MTALQTPADDAPASDWGRLAVSIPDWRWLPGMVDICYSIRVVAPQLATSTDRYRGRVSPPDIGTADGWCRAWVINYDPDIDDQMCDSEPDPDDPATAGCFLALLGLSMPDWWVATTVREDGIHIVRASKWGHARVEGEGHTLGRACIAAAAAIGRWPGGGA